uniref:PCI domain containing 2 n=1 Tax=Bos indicus x Bos taurus TaxID=30522 RepID=A0A4W2GQ12_BOBOX
MPARGSRSGAHTASGTNARGRRGRGRGVGSGPRPGSDARRRRRRRRARPWRTSPSTSTCSRSVKPLTPEMGRPLQSWCLSSILMLRTHGFRCTYAVGNHDFIEAYKCQTVIVQSFLRAFQAHKEENWALPVMYAVALDLRIFANNADQQLVKKGKSKVGDMLEKAAELLMGCFRVCASDTRAGIEDSKKWGMLFLVNQLFKIYFKINKLHLCKPLIRAIDSSNLKDDYSTAQRVTYRYYVGRKAMFDSDFKQAEEYLSFAFEHCHRSSQKNKRMVLIYLLPVKMLLGHMPTIELLRKYHLMQFAEVTRAVSEGNLLLLNEALAAHETFFIRCGIFLILEKLKIITYRNLFKKVELFVSLWNSEAGSCPRPGRSRISVRLLVQILAAQDPPAVPGRIPGGLEVHAGGGRGHR